MAKKIGYKGVFMYGAAGAAASTVCKTVRDVTINLTPERGDTSNRESQIKLGMVTQVALSVEWNMTVDAADPAYQTMLAAAIACDPIALNLPNGGPNGDFTLGYKKGEPLNGAQTYDFTAEPTDERGRLPTINGAS